MSWWLNWAFQINFVSIVHHLRFRRRWRLKKSIFIFFRTTRTVSTKLRIKHFRWRKFKFVSRGIYYSKTAKIHRQLRYLHILNQLQFQQIWRLHPGMKEIQVSSNEGKRLVSLRGNGNLVNLSRNTGTTFLSVKIFKWPHPFTGEIKSK